MTSFVTRYLGHAMVAKDGTLVVAEEPLAEAQRSCGGEVGGLLAIPELSQLVAKAQEFGLKLSRPVAFRTLTHKVSGWVDVYPLPHEDGCEIGIVAWDTEPLLSVQDSGEVERLRRELRRALPEFAVRLDAQQRILSVENSAPDLDPLACEMRAATGSAWTDIVVVQPIGADSADWRRYDGAPVTVAGSSRPWTAWLDPIGMPVSGSGGFVLTLVSDVAAPGHGTPSDEPPLTPQYVGENLAPSLRQPVNTIVQTAEAIHTRLAGPLADIYAGYAGDIVEAGEHLLTLVDNMAELDRSERIEPGDLERVDLGDLARQAASILGAKARERDMTLVPPPAGEGLAAWGDPRRIMQVLINLVGNAIAYAPEESQVWIRLDREGPVASVTVADQGRGLSPNEQMLVFDRFERLGRKGDGGSGLGLFISRRLAEAMGGSLTVESAPGKGARFTLSLAAVD